MRRRLFGIMLACLLAVGLVPAAAFALGQGGEPAPGDSAGAIETQSFATEHFPNYGFSDVDPGEWFASGDLLWYVPQHGLRARSRPSRASFSLLRARPCKRSPRRLRLP